MVLLQCWVRSWLYVSTKMLFTSIIECGVGIPSLVIYIAGCWFSKGHHSQTVSSWHSCVSCCLSSNDTYESPYRGCEIGNYPSLFMVKPEEKLQATTGNKEQYIRKWWQLYLDGWEMTLRIIKSFSSCEMSILSCNTQMLQEVLSVKVYENLIRVRSWPLPKLDFLA